MVRSLPIMTTKCGGQIRCKWLIRSNAKRWASLCSSPTLGNKYRSCTAFRLHRRKVRSIGRGQCLRRKRYRCELLFDCSENIFLVPPAASHPLYLERWTRRAHHFWWVSRTPDHTGNSLRRPLKVNKNSQIGLWLPQRTGHGEPVKREGYCLPTSPQGPFEQTS